MRSTQMRVYVRVCVRAHVYLRVHACAAGLVGIKRIGMLGVAGRETSGGRIHSSSCCLDAHSPPTSTSGSGARASAGTDPGTAPDPAYWVGAPALPRAPEFSLIRRPCRAHAETMGRECRTRLLLTRRVRGFALLSQEQPEARHKRKSRTVW